MTTIRFEIPKDIEDRLRNEPTTLSDAAKEAFLVDLYRRRSITLHDLCMALGLGRIEVEAVLKAHDVSLELSVEQFRAEIASLRTDRK